ncbi:MAG: hypothetical protein IH589_12775, partial [Anaerolineales bacterium]|nr:hypothetical protein [Anaerolineales bacterium]
GSINGRAFPAFKVHAAVGISFAVFCGTIWITTGNFERGIHPKRVLEDKVPFHDAEFNQARIAWN